VPKGVIVVLVVVAVVFALTLVVGKSKHGGTADPDHPPGIVSAFKGGGSPLKIEGDVTAPCASTPTHLSFSGVCNITLPSRSTFSRPVNAAFRAQSGATSVTVLPVGGDQQGPKVVPTDKACLSSAIDHKGARIELACVGGGSCTVDLVRSC